MNTLDPVDDEHHSPEPERRRAPVQVLEPEARLDDGSDGDHDRFAHIVFPKHKLTEALVMGTPVTALCGKTWVPGRDPQRYPMCPTCREIFAAMGKDFDALT